MLEWIATQKYRFDFAQTFLNLFIIGMLGYTNSERIKVVLANYGIYPSTFVLVIGTGVIVIFCTWLFGFTLDKLGFRSKLFHVQNIRNPQVMKTLTNTEKILEKINETKRDNPGIQ